MGGGRLAGVGGGCSSCSGSSGGWVQSSHCYSSVIMLSPDVVPRMPRSPSCTSPSVQVRLAQPASQRPGALPARCSQGTKTLE